MFGLINLHGIPKPTYRAYQLLHETGDQRLPVTGPEKPTPSPPKGTCGVAVENMDVRCSIAVSLANHFASCAVKVSLPHRFGGGMWHQVSTQHPCVAALLKRKLG